MIEDSDSITVCKEMNRKRSISNSEFKRKAREHQIAFREDIEIGIPAKDETCPVSEANYPIINNPKREEPIRVRSSLLWKDAKDKYGFRIFYSRFREDITKQVYADLNRQPNMKIGPLVTNLLRSEHIPYNVFSPMTGDLEGTTDLFNNLLKTDNILSITQITIEYNPGTLKDGTSFDVFIEYTAINGRKGAIGIEVKYTEKEYPMKVKGKNGDFTKEYKETHDISTGDIYLAENYLTPSRESGWFKPEALSRIPYAQITKDTKHVVMNHYRQIWRNHLLGASLILSDNLSLRLDEFTSLTVYPRDNGHFSQQLWTNYEDMLTDAGKATIRHITYEELFPKMRNYLRGIHNIDHWIDYLERRYCIEWCGVSAYATT